MHSFDFGARLSFPRNGFTPSICRIYDKYSGCRLFRENDNQSPGRCWAIGVGSGSIKGSLRFGRRDQPLSPQNGFTPYVCCANNRHMGCRMFCRYSSRPPNRGFFLVGFYRLWIARLFFSRNICNPRLKWRLCPISGLARSRFAKKITVLSRIRVKVSYGR